MHYLKPQKKPFELRPFLYQKGLYIVIIASVLSVLAIIFNILNFVCRYWFITLAIMLYAIIKLIRAAGTFLMFPGAFKYYRGSVELPYSQQLRKSLEFNLDVIDKICNQLLADRIKLINLPLHQLLGHFDWVQTVLQKEKDQGQLSARKNKLYQLYKHLNTTLRDQEGRHVSIIHYLEHQKHHPSEHERPSPKLIKLVLHISSHIRTIIREFFEDVSKYMVLRYWRDEKLYSIRYGIVHYQKMFDFKEHYITANDGNKISFIVIQNIKGKAPPENRLTVLFCNPNGAYMEHMATNSKYVEYYLNHGYCVCLWNYRGYGNSTGQPSMKKNIEDVLNIYDYLEQQGYKVTVTHGYSIGGPPAIYLAANRNISLLIADRTFGNLDVIAREFGKVFYNIMKLVFHSDRADYSQMYLNVRCQKITVFDAYDDVISNSTSLKTQITRHLINRLDYTVCNSGSFSMNEQSTNLFTKLGVRFKGVVQNKDGFLNEDFITRWIYNQLPFVCDIKYLKNPRHFAIDSQQLNEATDYFNQVSSQPVEGLSRVDSADEHTSIEVANILKSLDSAGMFPLCCNSKYLKALSLHEIYRQAEIYLKGLVVFGSVYPCTKVSKTTLDTRQDTLLKIYQAAQQLSHLEQRISSKHITTAINGIRHQLCQIGKFMNENLQNEVLDMGGGLLPTNSGHNGDLSSDQLERLTPFVNSLQE